MSDDYADFLDHKTQLPASVGFPPTFLPEALFDFQAALVDYALRGGRRALFEDCGLGKTVQELTWAQNVAEHTNRPVLVLAPLGVTNQIVREGEKFSIECKRSRDGEHDNGIVVANYERLHRFDASDFAGLVCDESSILKSADGATRAAVTRFAAKLRYRLLATATPSPNDFIELGTASEALGHLGFMDMLGRFFKNDRNNAAVNRYHERQAQWRFRGHAEQPFWRWVCSWARALRKPSDLGFDDTRFILPELIQREHIVAARRPREGMMFSVPAIGLAEEREERRRTLVERCETVARLVDDGRPAVVWCQLNDEGDLLERLIPDAVQVAGRDADEAKEEAAEAFSAGAIRVLVSKTSIFGHGLNWQHCAHMTAFGSHSYEQEYQSVRRLWRFGQTRPVTVDHVISDGEQQVLANLRRKERQAERMFDNLVRYMRDELAIDRSTTYTKQEEVPTWL